MNAVIILLGPTGVGKTGASILLAQKLGTDIISADSMLLYRGMNIGTAKPSSEQRSIVKHHMIDIIDPSESYSVGEFTEAAVPIIKKLHEKGKIPIVVGGTGLYIKALTRGIFSGPSADWSLREELLSLEKEEKGTLHSLLSRIDPVTAKKISINDKRRVVRAIEVCLKSPEAISSMHRKFTRPLPYDFVKVGLTRDRKELYRILELRVDEMISSGLVGEVKNIIETDPDRTPMQAIGYKEIVQHLNGEITEEEAVRLVKRNTKRYAKRQFTWFRKEDSVNWIDITGINGSREIYGKILKFLTNKRSDIFLQSGSNN
jgi:tRNA dimethylallyltransferase